MPGGQTVAASQVLGSYFFYPVLSEMVPTTSTTKTFGPVQNLNDLIPAQSGFGSLWATSINDGGAIAGTAEALDSNGNPILDANGNPVYHGVMLLPVEFVTDDGNSGFAQQTFTYNGTATPVIDASSSTASITADGTVSATIAGTVTDATSDCTPTASKQVQSLTVQAGATSNQVSLSNSGTPDTTNPWHPYKFLANFSQGISFAVGGPGQYPIEVSTSLNAAGMAGGLELIANVTPKVNQEIYNLILPSSYSPSGTNQIVFYEGAYRSGVTSQILTETGPGTNVFTGQLPFANVTVTINTFGGLTSSVDQLEATVVFTYSNGETKQTDVQFAETGATTDAFSAQVPEYIDGIDLGGLLNLTLPASFSTSTPDTVQTFVGSAAPALGPFVLTEDANNSLSFVGTTSWAQAQAQIVSFTGLTAGVDTITVNWTFTYPDGHQVTLNNVSMVETGATTNQFTYNLGAKVIYDVALIPSGTPSPGNFSPTIIRFKGPEVAGMTINVMNHDWQVAKKTYAGQDYWYVVDANNNPVVFNPEVNAHTDIQTVKLDISQGLSVVFKDAVGNVIATDSLPATTGLLVYGSQIDGALAQAMKKIGGWESKSWSVQRRDGSGNISNIIAYNYRAQSGQTVTPLDADVETEILWRYIGSTTSLAQFNSADELSKDIAYRLAIVNLILNKTIWFKFGEDVGPVGNPDFWGMQHSGFLLEGSSDNTTSLIQSLDDMFSDDIATEYKYSMDCLLAVEFTSLKAARNALSQSEFDSKFPPHSSIDNFKIWYSHAVYADERITNWIPGDRGYIANTGNYGSNYVRAGDNIIYLGGCFSPNPSTFENQAQFFCHEPLDLIQPNDNQVHNLKWFEDQVDTWNGGHQVLTSRCTLMQP